MRGAIFLVCILSSMGGATEICKIPQEGLDLIMTFPPEIQASVEAKKDDPKLFGVLGYSLSVPGVPKGSDSCWSNEGLVSVIPGTTDAPCSEAHFIYQYAMELYAREFNKQLLLIVPKLIHHKCNAAGKH